MRSFKNIQLIIIAMFLLVAVLMVSGCSSFSTIKKTTKKIARDLKSPDGDMKKKIGIALFDNKTFCDNQRFEEFFFTNLVSTIKEACSDILLVRPGDAGCPAFLTDLPVQPTGQLDNLALVKAGRQIGLNAIVTGSLIDIKAVKEEHGFLWFKGVSNIVQMQMVVEVYDTETAAKLLDEIFSCEIEVNEQEFELIKSKKAEGIAGFKNAFMHIAGIAGEEICDTVAMQPWKGYVVSISGNRIIISSGRKSGLIAGDILEVYAGEKIIKGKDGRRFFVPGLKTGEIKITTVYSDKAAAVSISADDINEGCLVRIK